MTTIERQSLVSGQGHRVTVDVHARNPLADDYRQVNPENYAISESKAGPPPKMFAQGTADLPAFTASGIEPSALLQLPYTARHAAAAMPDLASVHNLFENEAGNPDLHIDHPGLHQAIGRMRDWAAGRADLPSNGAA